MKKSIFLIAVLFSGCGLDCEKAAGFERKIEFNLIVLKLPDSTSGSFFHIVGKNTLTGHIEDFQIYDRWLAGRYSHINIGDTIIKEKSELLFKIQKKDTVLIFDWECEGKIYK